MRITDASNVATTEVTLITDPLRDRESQRLVHALAGCRRIESSTLTDGRPLGTRSVFEFAHADLAADALNGYIDVLHQHGISVRRVIGDHPAVRRANSRLGYV